MARTSPPLVVVVGAAVMDLVVRCGRLPLRGETVGASDLVTKAGGHGATQAVAAARLGATTHLITRVGADDFGTRLLSNLESYGVATTFATVTEGVATATSVVLAETGTGGNTVIASAGAAGKLTPEDLDRALPLLRTASVVLLTLEAPAETVAYAISLCHQHRVAVMLDPTPLGVGAEVPGELLNVTVLTPNQAEAVALLGLPAVRGPRDLSADHKLLAAELLGRGPRAVVLKLGASGALYADPEGNFLHVPAFKVKVTDSSSAGDAFSAALGIARAEGMAPNDALRFANAAGALATTHSGSMSSLPGRGDVEDLIRRWA
jgi:ribokinase